MKESVKGSQVTYNWSVEFDGKSVLALISLKPKMTYREILQVILNEGGYVDENMIIHKGSSKDRLFNVYPEHHVWGHNPYGM